MPQKKPAENSSSLRSHRFDPYPVRLSSPNNTAAPKSATEMTRLGPSLSNDLGISWEASIKPNASGNVIKAVSVAE